MEVGAVIRLRCAYVYPSRRRCANSATTGDRCDMHTEATLLPREVFCVCSACGSDLRASAWPGSEPCPHGCGIAAHNSRVIGRVVNDRVQTWQCPDCGRSIHRGRVKP